MQLTFVETAVFSARWDKRQDDDGLRALQNSLLQNPTAGTPLRGCPILRKIRVGDSSRGKGKRGGLRVIYLYTPAAARIDLLTVYGKDEADDLSRDEVSLLCEAADALREELASAARNKERRPSRRRTPRR